MIQALLSIFLFNNQVLFRHYQIFWCVVDLYSYRSDCWAFSCRLAYYSPAFLFVSYINCYNVSITKRVKNVKLLFSSVLRICRITIHGKFTGLNCYNTNKQSNKYLNPWNSIALNPGNYIFNRYLQGFSCHPMFVPYFSWEFVSGKT